MEKQIQILGVDVDRVDFAATLDQIGMWVAEHRAANAGAIYNSRFTIHDSRFAPPPTSLPPCPVCHQICTVNPEFIVDARRDPAFAAVLRRAALRVPDGVGVLWAARLAGTPLAERVTGSDGIHRIAERASLCRWRIFLLGAAPGVAATTAAHLRRRYPGLEVVGAYSGSPADADWPAIQGWLASTQPDILLVAFGHPKQDFWIDRRCAELPAAVAIGVGGAFDFVAGVAVRAPAWMQQMGIEWLHRLICEPWRWRRMMKLPVFVGLIILEKWKGKL